MYGIDSSGNLLSPLNIPDPLLRVELLREIRLAQIDSKYRRESKEWQSYMVQPIDTLSPDLIAWKVYQFDALKWVVMVAAGLDDTRERLQSGEILYLPSTFWLRERIREYTELCKKAAS